MAKKNQQEFSEQENQFSDNEQPQKKVSKSRSASSRTKQDKATEEERKHAISLARYATLAGGVVLFLPFFITGFSFGFIWYVLLIVVGLLTLASMGTDGRKKSDLAEVKGYLTFMCIAGFTMYMWGPINPNYASERNGGGDNSSIYPIAHKTEPCERCGSVGTYYESEDGRTSGDRRYHLHGGTYCYGCYQTMKNFSNNLGF